MTCPRCKGRGYLLVSVGSMGQHSVPCYCGGEVSVYGMPKSEIINDDTEIQERYVADLKKEGWQERSE